MVGGAPASKHMLGTAFDIEGFAEFFKKHWCAAPRRPGPDPVSTGEGIEFGGCQRGQERIGDGGVQRAARMCWQVGRPAWERK